MFYFTSSPDELSYRTEVCQEEKMLNLAVLCILWVGLFLPPSSPTALQAVLAVPCILWVGSPFPSPLPHSKLHDGEMLDVPQAGMMRRCRTLQDFVFCGWDPSLLT